MDNTSFEFILKQFKDQEEMIREILRLKDENVRLQGILEKIGKIADQSGYVYEIEILVAEALRGNPS